LRQAALVFALVLGFSLAGCNAESSLFGYQVGSRARPGVKTIRVPIFRNTTFYRDLEYELTAAIIKRIQDTTPYKVVTDGQADAQLAGTIRLGATHTTVMNELNESRNRDFVLAVEVSFIDARTGQDYFRPVTEQPPLPPPQAVQDPAAPLPLVPAPKPLVITRNAAFAQEIGQSFATAKQKVIEDLAIQIVNMMECPW
jgi:hypothetical protein